MQLLVISSMLFVFFIIVAVFHVFGSRIDDKERRIQSISTKPQADVDEELNVPFLQRFFVPIIYSGLKLLSRLFPQNRPKETNKLEKYLKLAGITISLSEYSAAKVMIMIGIVGVFSLVAFIIKATVAAKVFIIFLGVTIAVALPTLYLSSRIKNRQALIRNQMPDIMDLLTVSVEAGLSFDAALNKMGERFKGPLVDELMIVQREIQMALPRREALKNFANRSNVTELKTFVGAIVQADQLGLPIKNVLRVQSSQLRLSRKQAAEEKAMKAPIKMMLPLILFVFPVIFIILLGPTILQVIKTFG